MTGPLTARISSFRYPFCVVTRPTWAKELTPLPQITASKTPSPNTEPMVIRWQGFAASLYRSSPRRCNIHCVTTGASRSPRFSLKFQYSRFTLFLSAFLPSKVFRLRNTPICFVSSNPLSFPCPTATGTDGPIAGISYAGATPAASASFPWPGIPAGHSAAAGNHRSVSVPHIS